MSIFLRVYLLTCAVPYVMLFNHGKNCGLQQEGISWLLYSGDPWGRNVTTWHGSKVFKRGRVNLKEGYVAIKDNEAFLLNCHISPYSHGNLQNHDPLRPRKLLLHKKEISRLWGALTQKGLTLLPLKIYFKKGKAKVEIGLAKGKREYEKRATIKEKEDRREIERHLKSRR